MDAANFRVGRVLQQRLAVGRTGVPEELRGDNRDRGADILQLGVDTGTGQRGGRSITDILLGVNFKRIENDLDIRFVDRCRGRSFFLGRRSSLGQKARGRSHACNGEDTARIPARFAGVLLG